MRITINKIPNVQDLLDEVHDSGEKDNDCIQKHKGKVEANKKRGAKEIRIQVGDQVFMKNVVFPNKLTPNFNTTTYKVLERQGNIVKYSCGAKALIRDATHLKKI